MVRRVFITVAEASGDQHAAEFARSLKQLDLAIEVEGIGGPKMAAAGVKIHHETVGRAAMGWRGALRAWEVAGWMKWARAYYTKSPPALHVCVDSSAMNLPFAKLAKGFGVPVLYYIAPQLWASREGRIRKVRDYVDRLACIFPFEEKWFSDRGVNATFVGHPLFDALPRDRDPKPASERFPNRPAAIGILPGSRRSVAGQNFPHQLDVAEKIRGAFPDARFVVPTTAATDATVRQIAWLRGFGGEIKQDGFDELVPQCDLCLTVSGTATVHVAAFGAPMIVVYRANPILWHTIARWMIKTKKMAMVNILAGQIELVPEFVPWYGSNDAVADCALDLLRHPEKLEAQRETLRELISSIDRPGASVNVAKMAMEMMGRPEMAGHAREIS
jgi:lipid-A-disaccharide synthase